MPAEPNSPGTVPALDRSLDILEALSVSPGGLTLSELTKQLEVPKNAVFRITQTLLARGYVSRDALTMTFQLTGQFLKLALPRWGNMSLLECSRDAMRALRDATSETVQLGVLSGHQGVVINQIEGLEPLRIVVDIGLRFGLHNNAPGKLLLAYLPMDQRATVLAQLKLTATTVRTITTKSALRMECDRVKAQGYATDFAEADEGIHCVAAPIFRDDVVIATLWLSGPGKRLPKGRCRELGREVRTACECVSQSISALP
jgi:DNA-binding IclR family transcriptional regulator